VRDDPVGAERLGVDGQLVQRADVARLHPQFWCPIDHPMPLSGKMDATAFDPAGSASM
jgi:hypothetical protein